MHLSSPILLSGPISRSDILDIAEVRQSTLTSSELAVLRFGKIPASEALPWIARSTELELIDELKHPRIESNDNLDTSVLRGEHLVVRDWDLPPSSNHSAEVRSSDVQGGRIVAHAEWMYNPSTRESSTEAFPATEGAHPANPPPSGANVGLIKHFNDLVESTMAEIRRGVACYELRNISTIASHLRKGIGKQLTVWAFPYADRDNLPIILAASPTGYYLYRSCGFEDLTDEKGKALLCTIDMSDWGGNGLHHHQVMVRWPSTWTGPRNWQQYKSTLARPNH